MHIVLLQVQRHLEDFARHNQRLLSAVKQKDEELWQLSQDLSPGQASQAQAESPETHAADPQAQAESPAHSRQTTSPTLHLTPDPERCRSPSHRLSFTIPRSCPKPQH